MPIYRQAPSRAQEALKGGANPSNAPCQVEQVSFDRMVDPTDNDRLHDSDWAAQRVTWAVKLAIVGGVNKARSSVATNIN
jgi:hypothetical protein